MATVNRTVAPPPMPRSFGAAEMLEEQTAVLRQILARLNEMDQQVAGKSGAEIAAWLGCVVSFFVGLACVAGFATAPTVFQEIPCLLGAILCGQWFCWSLAVKR